MATVDQREGWTEAQARLYQQPGCQLKTLWAANGNGAKPQESPQDGAESHAEPPQAVEHPDVQPEPSSHHCAEHGVVHRGQLTPVELKLSVAPLSYGRSVFRVSATHPNTLPPQELRLREPGLELV